MYLDLKYRQREAIKKGQFKDIGNTMHKTQNDHKQK